MARKSSHQPAAQSDVRAKAAQMRLEQEAADKRMRNIIIGVVAAIVLAVSGIIGYVVATAEKVELESSPEKAAQLLGDYADGKPIVISHKGVGMADEALPTVTEYFDYSCHACSAASVTFGSDLIQAAEDGKFNLALQPVNTVRAPYHLSATSAAVIIARNAPEHLIAFHEAAMAFHSAEYEAGRATTIANATASAQKVKEIAQQVGVPQDVVDSLPANAATAYLEAASTKWHDLKIDDRKKAGTPEFIVNDTKKVHLSSFEPATAISEIEAATK